MPGFVVQDFGGIAPKVDARRLGDNIAQIARNCELDRNALSPLYGMAAAGASVGATDASIYYYNDTTWIGYPNDRDFAEVPIPNDTYARIVMTNPAGYPMVYSAGTTYRLGIPACAGPITIDTFVAPSDPDAIDAETISYVVTLVDVWGAEGPPSEPSVSIDRVRDTDVDLTLPAAPVGNYNFGAGALKRIYRSNAGTDGANYQYVGEVAITTVDYLDQVDNIALGEILPSLTWIGPPDDDTALYPRGPMTGVISLPNGMMAGFADNVLVFNEPYLYHAWPANYRITFDEDIVGISGVSAGVLVVTDKQSYLVSGVHPQSMSVIALDGKQAGVSRRGIVDMGEYALYPSPDGLVVITGAQAAIVTEQIFTREQWQAFTPATIHAYEYEGKYIAFYNNGTPAGFIFDPRGGVNAFVNITEYVEAAYYDPKTDTLYVNDAGTLRRWAQDSATPYTYVWRSKKFLSEGPTNFSVLRIQAWNDLTTSPVTARVYGDGTLRDTLTINSSLTPYKRLTGGYLAKTWEIELEGNNPVSHAGIYHSLDEAV